MHPNSELVARFNRMKKSNYIASLKLEGINSPNSGQIQSERVANKIKQLKALHA